jgi:hypothetical protein
MVENKETEKSELMNTATTQESIVSETEMNKFIAEVRPARIFKIMSDMENKIIKTTIVKVEDDVKIITLDEKKHTKKEITNKHLITGDEPPIIYSVNGFVINKTVDDFFAKPENKLPCKVQMLLSWVHSDDKSSYRVLAIKKI